MTAKQRHVRTMEPALTKLMVTVAVVFKDSVASIVQLTQMTAHQVHAATGVILVTLSEYWSEKYFNFTYRMNGSRLGFRFLECCMQDSWN